MKRIVIFVTAIIFAIVVLCAAGAANHTVEHAKDNLTTEVILDSDTGLGIDNDTVLWTPGK